MKEEFEGSKLEGCCSINENLLKLAGQTSSPAPLSYLTPSRSSTLAQFAVQNRRVSRLSDATSSSPSPKPYEASLLTPTPRTGLRGRSRTPSPAPSTEGQEYDTNLPQQILTPREVPMGDRASPKPTPTYDKMTAFQDRKKPGSSPKAAKRKKQPKKVVQESSSVPPRGSQSSPFKMKLTGVQHKDAKA